VELLVKLQTFAWWWDPVNCCNRLQGMN